MGGQRRVIAVSIRGMDRDWGPHTYVCDFNEIFFPRFCALSFYCIISTAKKKHLFSYSDSGRKCVSVCVCVCTAQQFAHLKCLQRTRSSQPLPQKVEAANWKLNYAAN